MTKNRFLKKYSGETALLLTTLLWGGTFVIVKNTIDSVSSMLFVGIRFLAAGIILLPFVYRRLLQAKPEHIRKGLILGFFLFLGFIFQTVGIRYTTATKSGFITGSLVMFTPFLQVLVEKKKPAAGSVIGSFVVLAGLIFLSSKGSSPADFIRQLGTNYNFGDFLTLLCAISYAMNIVYLDKVSYIDYRVLIILQVGVTSLLSFISAGVFAAAGIEPVFLNLNQEFLFGLAYTAVFATVITTSLQTRFQKEVSPAKAGILFSFEPIFAALFAYIMLGERVSLIGAIGCILIFTGLVISEVWDKYKGGGDEFETNTAESYR